MSLKKLLMVAVALATAVPVLYSQDGLSLGEIARRNRDHKNASPANPSANPDSSVTIPSAAAAPPQPAAAQPAQKPAATGSAVVVDAKAYDQRKTQSFIEAFENDTRLALEQDKFEALDQKADQLRSTKERLPGGFWTIHLMYNPLTSPRRDEHASETEWKAHIDRLKRWVAQRPQSITARVALADAYMAWGQKARGSGFANQVTEEGWRLFDERNEMAAETLVEAASLPAKCPEWFVAMQAAALGQGRSKETMAAIFEKAVAFDPDYQYFYRMEAESLLPKWNGEEGEMAAFAEKAADRLGGKRGDMIYYQIAIENCACDPEHQL
jgi:hypothetical protein